MIFHADSESDLKTSPNQVKNQILSKSDFYGTSTLKSPYETSKNIKIRVRPTVRAIWGMTSAAP